MTAYSFVSTRAARPKPFEDVKFDLNIRQQPDRARVCTSKERERRPVDPPPIIQLQVRTESGLSQNYLQNPHLFMCANLIHHTKDEPVSAQATGCLAGTIVSSLYRLKDIDNSEGGFFVFADVSIKVEGVFRLKFSLFELSPDKDSSRSLAANHIMSICSQPLTVYSGKTFPGMLQSTFLSRSFSDQGVRIRIRKEHRIQMKQQHSPREEHRTYSGDRSPVTSLAISAPHSERFHPDLYTMSSYSRPPRDPSSPAEVSPTSTAYVIRSGRRTSQAYHPYAYSPASPEPHQAPRYCETHPGAIPTSNWQNGKSSASETKHHYRHGTDSSSHSLAHMPQFMNPYHNGTANNRQDYYLPSRRSSQNSSASTGHSHSPDRHLRYVTPAAAHPLNSSHYQQSNQSSPNIQLPSIYSHQPLDIRMRAMSDAMHPTRPGHITQDLFKTDISQNGLKLPPLQLPAPNEFSNELLPVPRRFA